MSSETTEPKISRRKFLQAAALAAGTAASAGVLTACGASTSPTTAPSAEATFTPIPTISKVKPMIRFWPSVEYNEAVNTYVKEQAQLVASENGFNVEVFFTPSGEETAKYQAALESDTMPDVGSRVIDFAQFYPMGRLLDVSDICAEVGEAGGGWYDWALKQVTFDGKQYGLPFCPSPWVVYYHRPTIEAAGYSLPFKSFDELLDFAKAYSKPDEGRYAIGFPFASGDANGHTYSMLWGFDGRVQDESDNITLNTPEVIEALTWYTDLLTKHKVIPPEATGWGGSDNNNFYLNRVGPIAMNPPSPVAKMREENQELLEETYFGVLPPGPGIDREFGYTPLEVRRLFISSTTKYPDEAKLIVKHLMSPDIYGTLLEKAGGFYVPALKNLSNLPYFTEDPVNKAIAENCLPNGRNFGFAGNDTPWLGEAQAKNWWATTEQNIILKGAAPKDAVAEIAKQMQDAKDKYARAQ